MQNPEFYLVWTPDGWPPNFRHDTEKSAEIEAKRLAKANPGKQFHVLAHIGTAQRVEVDYKRVESIPF
ncbi:hypothetical protein [Gilvimarinus chinensis]|uniref:hypothetical protein n=1 Tax=Gilvimarinus chinensis TaxID=396005 RepID=UPI00035DDD9A|nr:hypothetical protein [Gilvimarinus chinensis]